MNKWLIRLLLLVAGSGWAVVIQLLYLDRDGIVLSQGQIPVFARNLQQQAKSGKAVAELSDQSFALLADAHANVFPPRTLAMREESPTAPSMLGTVSPQVAATRSRISSAAATYFGASPAFSTAIATVKLATTSSIELPAIAAVLVTDQSDAMDAEESVGSVPQSNTTVHVCICSDDPDFRPAIAAIRSAMASSASSHRLFFHFITTPELRHSFKMMSGQFLVDIRLEVHSDSNLQKRIQNHLARAAARARDTRKGLLSIFNFAPFYLPQFLSGSPAFSNDTEKLIYLDGDMISLGDLAALHDRDLGDMPCAAVPYCLQHLEHYVDFKQLASLGVTGIDPKTCIANRGLMVINLRVWQDMRITKSIEQWLQRFADMEKPLWAGGMSQPPWLLALNGEYLHLEQEWNCNGLAREAMNAKEATALHRQGFNSTVFKQLLVEKRGSSLEPYLATCSREGNLLHFNGGMKPWLIADGETRVPVCELPVDLQFAQDSFSWIQHFTLSGWNDTTRNSTFVRCAEIFWQFVEKKPPEYFSTQADTAEIRERRKDAMYFATRLREARQQRILASQQKLGRSDQAAAIREMLSKEVLSGGFKRQTMVAAVTDIIVGGRIIVPVGQHGMVMDKIRRRKSCNSKGCTNEGPPSLLAWFRKREDKKDRPIPVLPEEIRKLRKDEITKNDLNWKYRHPHA